jgi:hypothetical protein
MHAKCSENINFFLVEVINVNLSIFKFQFKENIPGSPNFFYSVIFILLSLVANILVAIFAAQKDSSRSFISLCGFTCSSDTDLFVF